MKAYLGPSSPSRMPPSEGGGGLGLSWEVEACPGPPTHSKASFYREVAPQASCSCTYTFKVPSS